MTQGQHRATARVLDILESLSGSEEGLTLTELSQALDAPKSSLFPIVHTLEERRYLRQDDGTGRYTMGPRALVLGAAFSADRGLAPITQVMKEVASKCQETCQMGILDQDRVLYQHLRTAVPLPGREDRAGPPQSPDCPGGDRKAGRNAKLWLV